MLKHVLAAGLFAVTSTAAAAQTPGDAARYKAEAARVTITRDDWGIAHIHGHTDADAVFGMIYAQCEDDFNRVETNYLVSLGRLAEAEGESKLWQDLRQRLFIDPEDLKAQYKASPAWLQQLMDAWADGLNFYLAQHPKAHPRVLTHFDPWMALSFTEGSIGGDIERIDLTKLQAFYGTRAEQAAARGTLQDPLQLAQAEQALANREPSGSNGIAIAPANTASQHALLLINPHTSFFFRSELQMSSDEGLNAYGAVTWGQFFIYQGFNERAGWMHTSSGVDAVDEFTDTLFPPVKGGDGGYAYHYADHDNTTGRRFISKPITLSYSTPQGLRQRTITAWYDHRGPIIRADDAGHWVSIELMNTPIKALEQSYLRIKAHTYADYKQTMALFANSSNNTLFADADGDIAYWHGNFIPRRDSKFDYTHPVDGANPATDWNGLLTLDQVPHLLNPASGFVFNVNDSPWNGAGASSLKQADFPRYVEQGIESARGVHALRLLAGHTGWTLDTLQAATYDTYLPWFARTLPALLAAYDALPAADPRRAALAAPIANLRDWDDRWTSTQTANSSARSIATTLAVFWGGEVLKQIVQPVSLDLGVSFGTDVLRVPVPVAAAARAANLPSEDFVALHVPPAQLLDSLTAAITRLTADFGTWQTPWPQINRFQRLTADIQQPFSDAAPSSPVPFPSALWGSLASFGARPYPGTKKWFGTSGNSFVAVVEFGPRVHARAVTAGGESGDPTSRHFNDEVTRYATGNLREVYFYPDQLTGHTERQYHPGS